MRLKVAWAALVLSAASPATAFAFGAIGCADLPEHDRAIGALEGMTWACDMTVERAQSILARDSGQVLRSPPPARVSRRHRRVRRFDR